MNEIASERLRIPPIEEVKCVSGQAIADRYPSFLSDESKTEGEAEYLFFPNGPEQVASVIRWCNDERFSVQVSGARTGITGGCVPQGGAVISTDRLDRIMGTGRDRRGHFLRVQTGVRLSEIDDLLIRGTDGLPEITPGSSIGPGELRYPVDPTERSASIGGTIATNASGARSYRYGPTRDWVRRLRVILPTGDCLEVTRGEVQAGEEGFLLDLPDGRRRVPVPTYGHFLREDLKNAAGVYAAPGMDLVDLFIGSEGILGVVVEADIWLSPRISTLSNVLFFPGEEEALHFVRELRSSELRPEFIEYMDGNSLALLRRWQERSPEWLDVPLVPQAGGAVLFDLPFQDLRDDLLTVGEIAEASGTSPDRSWSAYEGQEVERLADFRHALPEAVNSTIAARKREYPGIHKLGTDIAVPGRRLEEMMDFYRERMGSSGLEYVIFGHIGDNHLHVNILPENMEELERGKEIYGELVAKGLSLEGTVSGEHGIGRIKKGYLSMMYGAQGMEEMRRVKRTLDPRSILNPGNMLDLEVCR
ncbi:MAG: FAD-binding oxidoreductase [Methanomassiliicoccales archaeon]